MRLLASPRFGALLGALLLHGLAVALAARLGFRIAEPVEKSGSLALALAPAEPLENACVPEVAAVPERARVPDLPDVDLDELEAEVVTDASWLRVLPEEVVVPPKDAKPLDLGAFGGLPSDRGEIARRLPGAAGSGSGTDATSSGAVASVGAGAAGAGGLGSALAGTGIGPGTGPGLVAAEPRLPEIHGPAPLDVPSPTYPRLSRRAGEEGSVLCRLHISDQGLVTLVELVESSGFTRLDDAARETLARWRFEPRRIDGRAVDSTVVHRVTFRLDG